MLGLPKPHGALLSSKTLDRQYGYQIMYVRVGDRDTEGMVSIVFLLGFPVPGGQQTGTLGVETKGKE